MIDSYNRAAYKAVVYTEAARLLRDKYLPDQGDRPEIPCPDAFRAPRVVPPEVLEEVLVNLAQAARSEENKMQRFTFKEMEDDNPLVQKPVKAKPQKDTAAKVKGRSRATKKGS